MTEQTELPECGSIDDMVREAAIEFRTERARREKHSTKVIPFERVPDYGAPTNGEQVRGRLNIQDAGEALNVLPPPRGWLLGNTFCRGFISSLVGTGGTGKTALRIAQLIAAATKRPITGEYIFQRCRVLMICLEDNRDELMRRILACCLHHNIDPDELIGWLLFDTPKNLKLMSQHQGRLMPGQLGDAIEAAIIERKIDIVCIDPLIKAHSVDENNNSAIDAVMTVLSDLADKHNIAIDVPHHMSKGLSDPGNADKARGASAGKDAGRLVSTLMTMPKENADAFAIDEEMRGWYLRVDKAKVNTVEPTRKAKWFKLISVALDNGNDQYPEGDHVQTIEPWSPPDTWTDLTNDMINRVLDDIDAGLENGQRYSDHGKAGDRAAWKAVVKRVPSKTEHQAKEVIRAWVKTGLLVADEYLDRERREPVKGLKVDPSKRPGTMA